MRYSRGSRKRIVFISLAGWLLLAFLPRSCWTQEYGKLEIGEVQQMVFDISDDVKKHYYDPNLHGVDWEAKVRETEGKVEKAGSLNRALSDVAVLLDSLNDSHTFLLPPPRPYVHDYGFEPLMIGGRCFVMRVRPGSDAEAKGVKAGDEVVTLNGYTPTRADFWRMKFLFWELRPQPALRLKLRSPTGTERQIEITARIGKPTHDLAVDWEREERRLHGPRFVEEGNGTLFVKYPEFTGKYSDVDSVIHKMRDHFAVILDLRENPGGSVEALSTLLGAVLQGKVKVGDRVGRGSKKPIETMPDRHPYMGKIVVLVDSGSASAAEVFARVIQLEKRGQVFGDQSWGKVMESLQYTHTTGIGIFTVFGESITEADIRMTDGESLEGKGVTPNQVILPDGLDLASGRDIALAKAAESLGVKLTPEQAGKLFPYEWPKE